jgi:hypothetical protein
MACANSIILCSTSFFSGSSPFLWQLKYGGGMRPPPHLLHSFPLLTLSYVVPLRRTAYFYFMKKILFLISVVLFVLACEQKRTRPDDAFDTAREFIRSSLDGDYVRANELMLQDSANTYILERLQKNYNNQLSEDEKERFKKSSFKIHSIENASDTVVIVNYSNSYKNKQLPLKVVKKDGIWQVDLHYTFTGNL